MLSRRTFLKIFGFATLAFSFLPGIFARKSFSEPTESSETEVRVRSWLYGSPRRGCSTPDLSFGLQPKHAKGLSDLVAIHVPADFVS